MQTKVVSCHLIPFFSSQHPPPPFTNQPPHHSSFCPLFCPRLVPSLDFVESPPSHSLWVPSLLDTLLQSQSLGAHFSLPPRPPHPSHLAVHLFRSRQALHPLPPPQSFLWCPRLGQGSLVFLSCLHFPRVSLTHPQGRLWTPRIRRVSDSSTFSKELRVRPDVQITLLWF